MGGKGVLGDLLRQSQASVDAKQQAKREAAATVQASSPGNPFAAAAPNTALAAAISRGSMSSGNPFGPAPPAPAPAQAVPRRAPPPPPPPPPQADTLPTLIAKLNQLNPSFEPPVRGPSPVYKIILIGSANVGKTNVLRVFTENNFEARSAPTLKPEFAERSVPHPDQSGRVLRLALWDTMGQERYHAVTNTHYRRADGALLVYDVNDPSSFEALPRWLDELSNAAGDSLAMTMVCENKIDLLPEPPAAFRSEAHRQSFVPPTRVRALCEQHGLLLARTSAKCDERAEMWGGQTIYEAMMRLVKAIHAIETEYHKRHGAAAAPSGSGFQINNNLQMMQADREKSKCCGL